jgi:hypothetical protein
MNFTSSPEPASAFQLSTVQPRKKMKIPVNESITGIFCIVVPPSAADGNGTSSATAVNVPFFLHEK